MTEIELTPDRTKMLILVRRPDKAPHRDRFDPIAARQRKKQAECWGVEPDVFDTWCEEARVHGSAKTFRVPEPERAEAGAFIVRPPETPREKGTTHDMPASRFVKEVLPGIPGNALAEWTGKDALCCLDVDYHSITPPSREWLEAVVRTRVCPRPIMWHFSKSGGLHLFFLSAGDFTAEELAACAALRFRAVDRSAGLELKSVVFGPGANAVHEQKDQDTGAGMLDWLGAPEFEEEARDAWLESEGMECGKRYPHEKCPISPSAGAERDPVAVGEAGIYCFRCNGKGVTHGSRRPGWAPWSAILGSPSAGELGGLVRNAVHWGHAKWVLTERYELPVPFAKLAYKAALKAYHAGKPSEATLGSVFHKDTDGLARVNNLWMTIEESYTYKDSAIAPLLRCLPSTMYQDAEGKLKISESTVCELNQAKDQSHRGYRNIDVVHGFKLAGVYLGDHSVNTTVAVVNPQLRATTSRALPKYISAYKRMPIEDAWQLLETVLPRIDRTYITALIVGFTCAQETRAGLLPIVFASGPSSAGKTAMSQVAAGIVGARVGAEATFDSDMSKFRAGVFNGGQEGPVVVFNELLKDATRGRHKLTVREALDFVLNMTPHSSSHKMYVGPVKMGRLPALVITDTAVPEKLNEDTQLARRIRHHHVSGLKEDWKKTIAAAGVTDLHMIRTASDRVAAACDTILSDIVDSYFSIPATWDELADTLGVKTIQHSEEFMDRKPWLRELFRLVCAAPELSGREAKLYGHGYKKVTRSCGGPGEEEDDLAVVYSMFVDGPGAEWSSSRELLATEWSDVLKIGESAKLDLRGAAGSVYLRFRAGPAKVPTAVNREIVDPSAWERML